MAKPFEVGKTYKDTKGRNVRIIATNRKQYERSFDTPIIGLVDLYGEGRDECVEFYQSDGTGLYNGSKSNLIPEKERLEGWLAVCRAVNGTPYFYEGRVFSSRHGAMSVSDAIDAVKVVWED